MIIETFELLTENDNILTIEKLLQRLSGELYDDVLTTHPFLIMTNEGLVRVNQDKTISKNIAIKVSDSTVLNGIHIDENGELKVNKVAESESSDKTNNKLIIKLSETETIEFNGSGEKIIDLSSFINKTIKDYVAEQIQQLNNNEAQT